MACKWKQAGQLSDHERGNGLRDRRTRRSLDGAPARVCRSSIVNLFQHQFEAASERGEDQMCRDESLLQRTSLYREFLAEREEILKHKWFESEKAGRDVGFESALVSWITRHRALWRKARRTGLPNRG